MRCVFKIRNPFKMPLFERGSMDKCLITKRLGTLKSEQKEKDYDIRRKEIRRSKTGLEGKFFSVHDCWIRQSQTTSEEEKKGNDKKFR
jgi:hypothetical protein